MKQYARRNYNVLNYLHIPGSVTAPVFILPLFYMGKLQKSELKLNILKHLLAKFDESCYKPYVCQTVGQKLFLLHFYFFKHELLPLNAKIYIESRSKIKFSHNLLKKDQISVKAYIRYFCLIDLYICSLKWY